MAKYTHTPHLIKIGLFAWLFTAQIFIKLLFGLCEKVKSALIKNINIYIYIKIGP